MADLLLDSEVQNVCSSSGPVLELPVSPMLELRHSQCPDSDY